MCAMAKMLCSTAPLLFGRDGKLRNACNSQRYSVKANSRTNRSMLAAEKECRTVKQS